MIAHVQAGSGVVFKGSASPLGHKLAHRSPREWVVGGNTVARAHVIPVDCGERRLQFEHATGPCRWVVEALRGGEFFGGEFKHPLDVIDIRLACGGKLLVTVIALVGQPETTLLGKNEVTLGVAGVVIDEQVEEPAHAVALKSSNGVQERGDGGDVSGEGQLALDRSNAQGVDEVGVHERGEEVAHGALLGTGLGLLALDDDVAHCFFGVLGQNVERTVASLVRGNRRAVLPLTVHMTVQIILRAHGGIQLDDINSGCCLTLAHVSSLEGVC